MREPVFDSLHEPSKITITRKSSRCLIGRSRGFGRYHHFAGADAIAPVATAEPSYLIYYEAYLLRSEALTVCF
jgi:hypothetical protein